MKKLGKVLCFNLSAIALGLIFLGSYDIGANATLMRSGEVITEEVLLQKDNMINDIVVYEEGLNPFFATSKSALIANLELSKIEGIKDNGYVIKINAKGSQDIAEPVVVNGKEIQISIYSIDKEILDVLNNI